MNLRRDGRPLVVGHRGAAAVAPENTLESLAAAVEAGVDLVEFDVGERLVLGHSPDEMPGDPVPLDDALAFLALSSAGAHIDMKSVGIEQQVVDSVRRHGLTGRALISSAIGTSLRRVAQIAPEIPRAIGYPHDRHGAAKVPWPKAVTVPAAAALRSVMPLRLPPLLRSSRANVLALHQALVSRAVVSVAHARHVPVLGWTANDEATVERLVAAGVDGIVTDDPQSARAVLDRLFPV